MKNLSTYFFVIICFSLLSACATVKWVKSTNVIVAWDAPTSFSDGTPIPENIEIKYNVYIEKDTDNTQADKKLLTEEPISETSYTIDLTGLKGRYFVGIQSIADRDTDGELYNEPKKSRIAWSSNKADTKSGSFGIKVE